MILLVTAVGSLGSPTRIAAPDGYSIERERGIALSPDGLHVAFVVKQIAERIAIANTLQPDDIKVLDDTESATRPFWSQDGHTIGWFRGDEMRAIDSSGGQSWVICQCPGSQGTWGSRGLILFADKVSGTIAAVDEQGRRRPWAVTTFDQELGESRHWDPEFFPDGERFLFTAESSVQSDGTLVHGTRTYAATVADSRRELLVAGSLHASMLNAGTLIYESDEQWGKLRIKPLAGQDSREIDSNASEFSANGAGAYVRAEAIVSTELVWVDRAGKVLDVLASHGNYARPRISPDASLVAYFDGAFDSAGKVVVRDIVSRKTVAEFASGAYGVAWAPDSRKIVLALKTADGCHVSIVSVTGSDEPIRISPDCRHVYDWSADGKYVATDHSVSWMDISFLSTGGAASFNAVPLQGAMQGWVRFSPAGTDVAFDAAKVFCCDRYRLPTGYQVYLASMKSIVDSSPPVLQSQITLKTRTSERTLGSISLHPDVSHDEPTSVSPAGGYRPAWRADGKELFYIDTERRLSSIRLDSSTGERSVLFAIPRSNISFAEYDVTPDGQRFIINREVDDALLYVEHVGEYGR